MLADGLGQPVLAMAEGEAGSLGAAQLAAGITVQPEILASYQPGLDRSAYDHAYAIYCQLYPALRQVMHDQA